MTQWLHVNGEWFLPLIVGVSTFFLVAAAMWPRDLTKTLRMVESVRAPKGMRVDG